MNDQERASVRTYVSQRLEGVDFDDDENLFTGGHVNSMFAVQIVLWIERTFDMTMEAEDLDFSNIESIAAIVSFVERKRAKAA